MTLSAENENMLTKYMNNKYLPDVLGEASDIIFCSLTPDKDSLMMQHYYASPHDKFWRVLHQFHLTDRQIKTSLDPAERENNYNHLKSKGISLTDNLTNIAELTKNHKPKVLAFNGIKTAEQYFNQKVKYGEQKKVKIGKTRIFVLPSTAGSANASWNLRWWREVANIITK